MNPTDLADATARALDLLDSSDPAKSDPRLLRDPRLADEARLTREAAAEVWLAVSPLRVAPAEVLHELMAKIDPAESPRRRMSGRVLPWLTVSGWAAAAMLAFFLWPRTSVPESRISRNKLPASQFPGNNDHPANPPLTGPSSREARIRKDIVRLQERLASFRRDRANDTPRVISLTAPGNVRRTAEEARQRVQSILTNALRSALEAESATPADPASLVIERGWLPGGLPLPSDGGTIRHRNFPEHAWQEMGLLRSVDGEYFDASANTVWSADPDGRGFIGRKIAADEDVTRFNTEPDPAVTKTAKPRTVPEGFIIESPDDEKTEVVIDQVPEPQAGAQHFMLVTDSSGHTETIPVTPPNPAPVPDSPPPAEGGGLGMDSGSTLAAWTGNGSFNVNDLTGAWISNTAANSLGTVVFTLHGITGASSFQLVERPVIPNGQPDTIIVEGGP